MAVGRHSGRLAVLRSVALPQSPPRLHPPRRAALARYGAGRRLRVRGPGRQPDAAVALLRPAPPALPPPPRRPEPTGLAAGPGGAAPDVPRGRDRRGVRPPGESNLSGAVDRNLVGDGADQPVLRAGRVRTGRRD